MGSPGAAAATARILAARGLGLAAPGARAGDYDEFKVKRQAIYEFAAAPAVSRRGDKVTITFTSKGYCDVTVAIEDAAGRIVRHLAAGVLGKKAPPPLMKDSLAQTIVWDGKDDAGRYVDDPDGVSVRVSLGLKPAFERTLFWSPHKRIDAAAPVMVPAPEGVFLLENYVPDHGRYGGSQVRLFDHDGEYVRTIYPFPAGKLDEVKGLARHEFRHWGLLPLKLGYYQSTLLATGMEDGQVRMGATPSALAVRGRRMAVVHHRLSRLATDGSSGGLALAGPRVTTTVRQRGYWPLMNYPVSPGSAAFSPDGESLYLAGYEWNENHGTGGTQKHWLHGVMRMDFAKGDPPEVFLGSMAKGGSGSGDAQFNVPCSVACDAKGRVYVADNMNDRVRVFSPAGKLLKTIPVRRPAHVAVHHRTGEIYVFTWLRKNASVYKNIKDVKPTLTKFGPLADPKLLASYPLPLMGAPRNLLRPNTWDTNGGSQFRAAVDTWTDPPTIWLTPGPPPRYGNHTWERIGILMMVEKDGKLAVRKSFGATAAKAVVRATPPVTWRQRLYVNPASGKLYIGEGDSGVSKSFNQLVEIDPAGGRTKLVDLPLGAEDICFDQHGRLYVRTDTFVVRYDSRTWREIPFDYGEQRASHSWGMGARGAKLVSGLLTTGHRSNPFWHMGGFDVSLTGHIAVTTCNLVKHPPRPKEGAKARFDYAARPYLPKMYPGRMRWGEIHIYDSHGKLVREDAVPGMGHLNGIGIDSDDNLYLLAASKRMIGGKLYDPTLRRDTSGTLLKVPAGGCRVLSAGTRNVPVPLPKARRPDRPIELKGYTTGWVEGADWFYGGVGFCTPGSCICSNSRFDLDYFNRSFAPEPLGFSVAVLDAAGNLITRIWRYGNVDDGRPLVPAGGPARTRPIGGDETALLHACYVAVHTDRRLFIADQGNARVLSVKLGYHKTVKLALRGLRDTEP